MNIENKIVEVDQIVPISGVVAVNNFPAIIGSNTIRADYDGSSNLIYFADAAPGTLDSNTGWRIRKLSYDGSANFLTLTWPSGDNGFNYIWNNRASYTYI